MQEPTDPVASFEVDDADAAPSESRSSSIGGTLRTIVMALVAAGLAVFIMQNTAQTPVTWISFSGSAPLWIVILGSAAAGGFVTETLAFMWRRGRRKRQA